MTIDILLTLKNKIQHNKLGCIGHERMKIEMFNV